MRRRKTETAKKTTKLFNKNNFSDDKPKFPAKIVKAGMTVSGGTTVLSAIETQSCTITPRLYKDKP